MRLHAELNGPSLDHHWAMASSPKTVSHYINTFMVFHRFLRDTKPAETADVLVRTSWTSFAVWLSDTQGKFMRGRTTRMLVTIQGHLLDMWASVR
jgi:hypothetical protein